MANYYIDQTYIDQTWEEIFHHEWKETIKFEEWEMVIDLPKYLKLILVISFQNRRYCGNINLYHSFKKYPT